MDLDNRNSGDGHLHNVWRCRPVVISRFYSNLYLHYNSELFEVDFFQKFLNRCSGYF